VGALDIGFVPGAGGAATREILAKAAAGAMKVVYLLGADEMDTAKLKDAFVIYQGHHGDAGADVADVILPGAAYTEKDATYVNTEGRAQRALMAVPPPGEAKEDWKIIRALSGLVGSALPFDTAEQLRAQLPLKGALDTVTPAAPFIPLLHAAALADTPFVYPIQNFYRTDVISRVSKTMAECTKAVLPSLQPKAA
jgi:NADH-quinone oxidoreductase subunit G